MGSIGIAKPEYDVLVIGAGLSGCYACYRMQKLNLNVKVLEAGSSVGGTWYWSRSDLHRAPSHFSDSRQIDIPALVSIANHTRTVFLGRKNFSKNGTGPSTLHLKPRPRDTSNSSVIASSYGTTCSSTHVFRRLIGMRHNVFGN